MHLAEKEPNHSKEPQKATEKAKGKMPACFFMKGATQKAFGQLLKDLDNDCALGEDKFPETMEQALEVLNVCEQRNTAKKPQQPQGPRSQDE